MSCQLQVLEECDVEGGVTVLVGRLDGRLDGRRGFVRTKPGLPPYWVRIAGIGPATTAQEKADIMKLNGISKTGPLGLAAGAALLAAGLATAGPAGATPRFSATVAGDTLTITAGSGNDRLALSRAEADNGLLAVDFGDNGSIERTVDLDTFSRINVFLGSGNDRFRVDQTRGTLVDEALRVDGGSGNDVMDGGDGVELFVTGSGNDAVDGNRGDDRASLGSGQDSFRWDPGDGSDIVEGGSGTDTLDFNGAGAAENMQLVPNGQRSLFLRDVANIRMDMLAVEQLDLTALGGVDTVTVEDMTGTGFRHAAIDLSNGAGAGDGQADRLTVNGTNHGDDIEVGTDGAAVTVDGLQTDDTITGSETSDLLQINARGGDDDVEVADDVEDLIGVNVDLGTGQH
jgi:hemolysin type calcium-binding protein